MRTLFQHHGRGWRARILAPVALASAGALLISSNAPANDRFVAGEQGTATSALPFAAGHVMAARAAIDAALLGLPAGTTRHPSQVTNRFLGRSYIEVTAVDSTLRPVSLLRYDLDGSIRTAIKFGWHAPSTKLAGERAEGVARALASRARIAPSGTGSVTATPDGGFSVQWRRTVEDVPVKGDGVRIVLWPDGTLHSLAREERPLAARPATRLDREAVTARLEARLREWFGTSRPLVRTTSLELAWVAPNDMFDRQAADAPGSTLRLAWVATLASSGIVADRWAQLQVWFDAGDGMLLGGDINR